MASEASQRRTPPERAGSGPGQRCRSRCRPRQVEAGRTETELSVARAQIESRKADLELATIQLAESELKAPFDGVIAQLKLKEREYITPGTSVVQLADTATWQIETNDLTELHIVKVNQGDQVTITVDALPGFELPGMVKQIEDLGENQQGDIVYSVTVQPAKQDPCLKWIQSRSLWIATWRSITTSRLMHRRVVPNQVTCHDD